MTHFNQKLSLYFLALFRGEDAVGILRRLYEKIDAVLVDLTFNGQLSDATKSKLAEAYPTDSSLYTDVVSNLNNVLIERSKKP